MICGLGFDPEDLLGWHHDAPAMDADHEPHAEPTALAWVLRRRIRDTTVAHVQMGAPSKVGTQRVSRVLTLDLARREADAWNDTGDWVATVNPTTHYTIHPQRALEPA